MSDPFTMQGGDIRGEKQKSPAFRENRGSKIYPTASPRKLWDSSVQAGLPAYGNLIPPSQRA